jgi:hypothetical protein
MKKLEDYLISMIQLVWWLVVMAAVVVCMNRFYDLKAELAATQDNLAHVKQDYNDCEVLLVDKNYQSYYANDILRHNTTQVNYTDDWNISIDFEVTEPQVCNTGLYGQKVCKADEYVKNYSNGLCDCIKKDEVQ